MRKELDLQRDYLADKNLTSIYFGGGTPSLILEEDVLMFLDKINQQYVVETDAEITLEANPDDLTKEKLATFKRAGINRLSIGIQSFYDDELQLMNRSHNAMEAERCVKLAQDIGFENITIDLIFGLPGSTLQKWQHNLDKAISLKVPHFSAYSLTVEPTTALAKMIEKGKMSLPEESEVLLQYRALCQTTKKAGFTHYELSNYGKPGFESRHNTSYWSGAPYLGIGPSAHSFNGHSRQWNIANNTLYTKNIDSGKAWFEREEISTKDAFNEFVMTGLRTSAGIILDEVENKFHRSEQLLQDAQAKLECGKLELNGDTLIIPENEWMMSDSIISDLFWVNE